MVTYRVIKENLINTETGSYTSYGIGVYNTKSKSAICVISDVFISQEKAVLFTTMCNDMQLDIVHLPNVIEDCLMSL